MKIRISLVEDDFTMRGLLKTLLEIEGFEVLTFDGGGENFIEKMKKFNPHFILMDYHLKNSSGLDLLRLLRSEFQSPCPIILMISGENRKDECLGAGADGFLLKPFMPDELIEWLHEREKTIDVQKN
jgi:DNA-binding response OmpR family regulator